jgi:hypothetical protein
MGGEGTYLRLDPEGGEGVPRQRVTILLLYIKAHKFHGTTQGEKKCNTYRLIFVHWITNGLGCGIIGRNTCIHVFITSTFNPLYYKSLD